MKTISLKLPERLDAKLNRVAKLRGETRSSLVRAALQEYLNGDEADSRGSFLEAARKWIGCAEGPGDLSTNPTYMDDFGR